MLRSIQIGFARRHSTLLRAPCLLPLKWALCFFPHTNAHCKHSAHEPRDRAKLMSSRTLDFHSIAIIGGGPAGLMAAEVLSLGGVQVDLYDAMPSVGRKFLLAGKGGMNLTHAEPS